MDIACPNCAAAYRVPDALVLSRKPVRCAACGTRWVPDLPEAAVAEAAPAEPAPAEPAPLAPPPAAEAPPAPLRSLGAEPDTPAEPLPPAPSMSLGTPPPVVTETGALTPRPAAPPPLAETRWSPGTPAARAVEPRERRRRGAALLPLAWAGSLLVLGGAAAGLFAWRHAIAAAWPPYEWVVRLLGG